MELILYGPAYSIYMRIARLVLHEKGIDYVLKEFDVFDPGDHPADFSSLHPFSKVPVLKEGDFVLYETGAICRYIDEQFPGPSLQPSLTRQTARMNQVISIVDNYGYSNIVWGIFVERVSAVEEGRETDEEKIKHAMPIARKCLNQFDQILENQNWFAGEQISLADCYVMPVILYFLKTPEGRAMLTEYAHLGAWWQRVKTRPSLLETPSPWG